MTPGREISVSRYQNHWADDFAKLADIYYQTLGELLIKAHHVGSTSVKGLVAKPRIDIDLEIANDDFDQVREQLEKIGYQYQGDLGIPGRYAFKYRGDEQRVPHNMYVCSSDSKELQRHLIFRDYLRTHHEARKRYSQIKLEAIKQGKITIEEYMDHKGQVVVEILQKAYIWADIEPEASIDNSCPYCGSDSTEQKMTIKYTGNGNKTEGYDIWCTDCGKSSYQEIR